MHAVGHVRGRDLGHGRRRAASETVAHLQRRRHRRSALVYAHRLRRAMREGQSRRRPVGRHALSEAACAAVRRWEAPPQSARAGREAARALPNSARCSERLTSVLCARSSRPGLCAQLCRDVWGPQAPRRRRRPAGHHARATLACATVAEFVVDDVSWRSGAGGHTVLGGRDQGDFSSATATEP